MVTQQKLWAHDTRHRRGERQGLFILMNPVNSLRVPPDRQRTHFLSAQKRDRVNFQGPRRRLGRLQSLRHRATWSQRVRTDVDQHGYAVDVLDDVYSMQQRSEVLEKYSQEGSSEASRIQVAALTWSCSAGQGECRRGGPAIVFSTRIAVDMPFWWLVCGIRAVAPTSNLEGHYRCRYKWRLDARMERTVFV
jgi:hypothetical protein